MKIQKILRDSPLGLKAFPAKHLQTLERAISERGGKFYAVCAVRGTPVQMKPEEVVRQLFLMKLMKDYGYPQNRLAVEYAISFGREQKRADIVVMDKDRPDTPYIVAEIKKPQERDGKAQLKSYCNATGAPMAVWCNGNRQISYHRKDPNYFEEIRDIPESTRTLKELLQVAWTLDDLIKSDILVKEGRSLKNVIEGLEDEVLANSGVDIFEEAFKLIFAKLYDEWVSGRDKDARRARNLEFHNAGETDDELKAKIQNLFDKAKEKWQGVFADGARIDLTPSHLAVCIGSLERVKLFNSNLDVVDDAFEYLINKENRGDKGQYFTPRYVIDMCVKMLNPEESEYMIDPAAGSSGFPIHAIFHVWKKILKRKGKKQSHLFTIERKPAECDDYVRSRVFAIDFDEKAVRVSRALNLIAGDGQTNVLKLNTLDYKRWEQTTGGDEWRDVYHEGEKKLRRLRTDKTVARDHKFDIVMANPPFAGDIRESEIIHLYELGKKMEWRKNIKTPPHLKKWHEKISRHILFIERNLQFLKPGGRMAIVLPQGIFNNITDFPQRHFIMEHCRILAVVGLHTNTFKPHTGTKTSVLFVQKWNDDPKAGALCPHKNDYNIFFATMQKSGKNNSGDKIFVKRPLVEDGEGANGAGHDFLLDDNGHLILEHDLFNLFAHHFPDGCEDKDVRAVLDSPGIAEAFLEFAKKEELSFAKKFEPFSKSYYKELLNGLEVVDVNMREVRRSIFRLDSEHFRKRCIDCIAAIERNPSGFYKLGDKIISMSGGATPLGAEYPAEGVPFLRVQNIMSNYFNLGDIVYLSPEQNRKIQRSQLRRNDVLFTITGSYGKSSVVPSRLAGANINQHSVRIAVQKDVNPFFLSCFLNTTYGRAQTDKYIVGISRPALDYRSIKQFSVPVFSDEFQFAIESALKTADKAENDSKRAMQAASDMLLSELGLDKWRADDGGVSVKRLGDVSAANRWDAEYYLPKYDCLLKTIKSYPHGWDSLANCRLAVLKEEMFSPANDSNYQYIELADVGNYGNITGCTKKSGENLPDRARRRVNAGDVIVSSVEGSLSSIALIDKNYHMSLCSTGFHVVAPRTLNAETLLVLFKSIIGQMQLRRGCSGTILTAINGDHLNAIILPMVRSSVQDKIRDKISAAYRQRNDSILLLQTAKAAVETAIEKGEKAAMRQLTQNALPPNSETN